MTMEEKPQEILLPSEMMQKDESKLYTAAQTVDD